MKTEHYQPETKCAQGHVMYGWTTDMEATRQLGRMQVPMELPAMGVWSDSPSVTGRARQPSCMSRWPITALLSHITHYPPKNRSGGGDLALGDATRLDGRQPQNHTHFVHHTQAWLPSRLTCVRAGGSRGRGMQQFRPLMQVVGQHEAPF